MSKKKNGMTREEAAALYDQLKRNLDRSMQSDPDVKAEVKKTRAFVKAAGPEATKEALKRAFKIQTDEPAKVKVSRKAPKMGARPAVSGARGKRAAVALILAIGVTKIALAGVEASGMFTVEEAQAKLAMPVQQVAAPFIPRGSAEEKEILLSLDARRAKLEERNEKLNAKESELDRRDREFAARLTEIRSLTEKLKSERAKDQRKRGAQLDQLANVYGSMNPSEAATLIEQLDVTIAIGLIKRMPEKRIGQILSMMSPNKALTLTQMLSGTRR